GEKRSVEEVAEALAKERRDALQAWGLGLSEVEEFTRKAALRVITPGHTAGEPLHGPSAREHPGASWSTDRDGTGAPISAASSLLRRLTGRDPDTARGRAHALLSVFVERRMDLGLPGGRESLLQDPLEPPLEVVGSLPL